MVQLDRNLTASAGVVWGLYRRADWLRLAEAQACARALEPYVSQLFKKASAYAELTYDSWHVLSAKHGPVHPDEVIEPYDVRLGTETSAPVHIWAAMLGAVAGLFGGIRNAAERAFLEQAKRIEADRTPKERPQDPSAT